MSLREFDLSIRIGSASHLFPLVICNELNRHKVIFSRNYRCFPINPPPKKIRPSLVPQPCTLLEMSELGKVSPQISIILKTAFISMEYFALK